MNRIHRSVWCPRRGTHIAVAETSPQRSKASGVAGALLASALLGGGLPAFAAGTAPSPDTLPTGAQVLAGAAQISQSGSAMTITQGSARAAIDWQSFSVGSNARVNFVQPSAQAVVLNRVLGSDVSVIQGAINANGQVFLVNPNGVLFTPTAQVNVGALVASTHNVSTADFMAGQYRFSGSSTAAVENQGQLNAAAGGAVALIAARVVNSGTITAAAGRIGLAAANTVTLDLGGPVLLNVSEGALNAEIAQGGALRADGGQIFLTARAANNLAAAVINHSGVTEAKTLADVTGSMALQADIVSHTGTLDASGAAAGQRGGQISVNAALIIDAGNTRADGQAQGGRIEQRATQIEQTTSARLSANSAQGQGGSVRLLGDSAQGGSAWLSGTVTATGVQGGQVDATAHRLVAAGLQVDTSGTQTAGQVRLGGGWQGHDADLANATTTTVGTGSTITNGGAGGRVVVWSDEQTRYGGHIQASGSAAEVSGKEQLLFAGTAQTASLLLDPKNINIQPVSSGLNALTISNPNGTAGDAFGQSVTELTNGNLVITAHTSDVGGVSDVGRVYLYQPNGTLVSVLTGSSAGDSVGFRNGLVSGTGVVALNNGNYVVGSAFWDNGLTVNTGAITWGSGTLGVSGVISSNNSLIGSTASDFVATGGITPLNNGNYVVASPLWRDGSANSVGAVTWGNGTGGTVGIISSTNSLVGNSSGDRVGEFNSQYTGLTTTGVIALTNGNYVVHSSQWNSNAGAVTWGSGTAGVVGLVSSSNSLIGSVSNPSNAFLADMIGFGGVVALNNGNYVVSSPWWDNVSFLNAGAVTWGNGAGGTVGTISQTNSLVGYKANDYVGGKGNSSAALTGGVSALTNGNYVVSSSQWDNGATTNVGAVTWGNGLSGTVGLISSTNSLVGLVVSDYVGFGGIVPLNNGNYVAISPYVDGVGTDAGAVTWGQGTGGTVGVVNSINSLVGSQALNRAGSGGVTALSNGHYVVNSPNWKDGTISAVGAVTWGNGVTGTVGVVGETNSLIGSTANDKIGTTSVDTIGSTGIIALTNGNYVVRSSLWDDGNNLIDVGAITWGNGNGGTVGRVSAINSLVGTTNSDSIGSGSVIALANGNYVVGSPRWNNGTMALAGAVTWGSGTGGTVGVVDGTNSLIGTYANDSVGYGLSSLSNGNYVAWSLTWDNFLTPQSRVSNAGHVTWGNGSGGTVGSISSSNSLVGSFANDLVSNIGVTVLKNGGYLVRSASATLDGSIGVASWGNGTGATIGALSRANSISRGCPKFCVNGQMAGNCRTSRKMNHDRKQRIDRPAARWL